MISSNMSSSSPSSEKNKMIALQTSDKEIFEVEEAVAMEAQTIKHMIEDGCADGVIPLPLVNSRTLSLVIQYCTKHHDANNNNNKKDDDESSSSSNDNKNHDDLKDWDAEFVKVDQSTLFDLIRAANYLNITSLLDLTCESVADMIKGRTPEEIRKIFNIKNDLTPEEEEEIRRENHWAFE